jgi:murein DD-endopeptidase MepM/ murein hydrolase activator NlpD
MTDNDQAYGTYSLEGEMRNKIWGFAVLAVASVMAVAGTGAQAQEPTAATQKTGGEAVGAEVVHPAAWNVEREPYTYDDTYGYTLWYPDTEAAHDHGGRPALRVALAYDLDPEEIEAEVEGVMADHPELSLRRERVGVAREHEGVAVGTIPGSTPYTAVYVPVNGRVYKINVYADDPAEPGLDARSRGLLADVRFEPPTRSVGSLDLPDANSPEALAASVEPGLVADEEAEHRAATEGEEIARISSDPRGGGEKEIAEGCYLADPRFWVQTQHGKYANKDRWKGRRPGWTRIGLYNYWGEYTHGDLGYGRCDHNVYTNDKFAIDYFLERGDAVFSSFRSGTVRFAGRADTHKNYGIFVAIEAEHGGERYVSMSAHLNGLRDWVRKGASVNEDKIIGFAGNTGAPDIPVGKPHLHQAFYRNPSYLDGAPRGGQGLQVIRHHFIGTAARDANGGVYTFGRKRQSDNTCRASIVCGKGYFISN